MSDTIKTVTNCPTCGAECSIGVDGKEGTHYYIPKNKKSLPNITDFVLIADSLDIDCNTANRLYNRM